MNITKRPKTMYALAHESTHEEGFGRNLADFEHELVRCSSRREIAETITAKPALLAGRFPSGRIADAWLAAYAEELASRFGLHFPKWIWAPERFLEQPYVHDSHSKRLKAWHTLKSPVSFSRRNLFVDFQLPPVRLKRGRPRASDAHKREMNRQRVARHRAKGRKQH